MPRGEKLSARYPKCFFCAKSIIKSRNPIDQEKYVICDTECSKPIIFHRDCADENMSTQKNLKFRSLVLKDTVQYIVMNLILNKQFY